MNWRNHGFTQRKPKGPGVYFVAGDLLKPSAPPESLRQGWDVARVMFWAGSYTNAHDNRESAAHWRITTLGGVDYAWKPGMWLKGPISPLQPNTKDDTRRIVVDWYNAIDAAIKQREQDAKDAARYRWLADSEDGDLFMENPGKELLDRAIDSAMVKESGNG